MNPPRRRTYWLRYLLTALVLVVFGSTLVLAGAHAGPPMHAEDHVAISAGDHGVGDRGGDQAADEQCCHPDTSAEGDCAQVCSAIAVASSEVRVGAIAGTCRILGPQASDLGRTPSGILRPPRLS